MGGGSCGRAMKGVIPPPLPPAEWTSGGKASGVSVVYGRVMARLFRIGRAEVDRRPEGGLNYREKWALHDKSGMAVEERIEGRGEEEGLWQTGLMTEIKKKLGNRR